MMILVQDSLKIFMGTVCEDEVSHEDAEAGGMYFYS
jgi:hypothetical protein